MKFKLLTFIVVLITLAACSGGGGSDSIPLPVIADPNVIGTDIAQSATQTAAGSSIFVKRIVLAGDKDMDEALVDGNAELASSETDEPDPSV